MNLAKLVILCTYLVNVSTNKEEEMVYKDPSPPTVRESTVVSSALRGPR
jgi:hypothetical protein